MGLKLVFADADPQLGVALVESSNARGHDARAVASGTQLITETERDRPDVVIVDVDLPELTGYEICRRLRGEGSHQDIAVVFYTRRSSEADRFWAAEMGGSLYLTKGQVPPAELIRSVEQLKG